MSDRPTPDKGKRGRQAVSYLSEVTQGGPVFPFVPGLTDIEKEIWVDIVNTRTGDYWNRGDIPILKMYCRLTADIDRLTDEIRAEGEVIENSHGNPIVNPKIVIRTYNEAKLMTLCTKLRMQPSSRVSGESDRHNTVKKSKATNAAATIADDEDGLLAGGGDTLQ